MFWLVRIVSGANAELTKNFADLGDTWCEFTDLEMILQVSVLALLLLTPLHGPGSGPHLVQSLKDDDFAEFEEDDSEFDFEVADEEEEEDCECHVTKLA